MYVYGSVLVKDGNKHRRKTKIEKTKKMNVVEETKYVKDYLYSLYKRNLITLERYIHKLGLIEEEGIIDLTDVSKSLFDIQ